MDTSFRTLAGIMIMGSPILICLALLVFVWHRIWNRFAVVPLIAPPLYACAIYATTLFGSEQAGSLLESEHNVASYMLFLIVTGTVMGLWITARLPENSRFYSLIVPAYMAVLAMPALVFVGQDGQGKANVIHAMWAFPLGLGFSSGLHRRIGILVSFIAALTLAFLDEVIQIYLPERVFDIHDIWLNLTAATSGYALGIIRQIDGEPLYSVILEKIKKQHNS